MSICEEKDVTLYQNQISITMEPSIYSFSLYTALPLMLFFGFYFLFAKTPEKKIFKNYLRSRQIMGIAMLLLPDKYVFIWILSSIPFYSYLFYSYQNYLLFYEQVENAFEQDIQSEEELLTNSGIEPEMVSEEVPESYTEFIEKVDNWIKTDGYVQQGLTIKELSEILHTNRTYLSAYIKTTYKMTFREWITGLRLEYAKNILKEHPEINIQKLAESSGFLSQSNFIKLFSEKEGCTPAKWKKSNRE